MAKRSMTPAQANELLNALQMAQAACSHALNQVETYSDLYEQLEGTLRRIEATSESVMGKFVPAAKTSRAGGQ